MKRIFILLIIVVLALAPTCSAATNWERVHSDADHTYSIDRSSLKTVLANDGSVKSKRCFVRVDYTSNSAQEELQSVNINSSDSSIHSVFDITFDFADDSVLVNGGFLYNSGGSIIHNYPSSREEVRDECYAPIFYFLLQEFSGGNPFDLYNHNRLCFVTSYHDSNGIKFNIVFDELSVYTINSRVYFKIYTYDSSSDDSLFDNLFAYYCVFDTSDYTVSVIDRSSYTKSRGWYVWKCDGMPPTAIYPDTCSKITYEKILLFCKNNPIWVNRHNGSGIMPKAFVGHPII